MENLIYGLLVLLFCYLMSGFTWFWYLAVMHLKHNKNKLNPTAKFFGYPWMLFAYVTDVLFNFIVGTIFFVEIPR